jgi:hypothetical protein
VVVAEAVDVVVVVVVTVMVVVSAGLVIYSRNQSPAIVAKAGGIDIQSRL